MALSNPPVQGTDSGAYAKTDISHRSYNDPAGGNDSNIGPQIRTDYYAKKALIEMKKDQFFSPMADTTSMPKHFGKTIKKFHYLPLLDDRNINDQGIDAAGLVGAESTVKGYWPVMLAGHATIPDGEVARVDAVSSNNPFAISADVLAYVNGEYPDGYVLGNELTGTSGTTTIGTFVTQAFHAGNLYGSSKDPGVITSKMPALSEHGGRVNRVGFKRVELEGTLEKFGFFDEYTQESVDFDTDSELMMHVNREMLRGANEITEDALQIDLLNNAGVVRYANGATDRLALVAGDNVMYEDLQELSIDLDKNRCPMNTSRITGSRMIDTKTIDRARYLHIGIDLQTTYKNMVDSNTSTKVFIPAQQYGAATSIAQGEIGSVDEFRIIVVPEMMAWEDATTSKLTVYPSLVIGSGSFTTVGFQTDGKTVKFKITHKKPGKDVANRDDPYGEIGFMSIKWYYGFMVLRPEWLAVIESVKETV